MSSSLNGNEARLQAQAALAAVYEKSLVYPSNNTLMWCPGYPVLPQLHGTSPCPINGEFDDIQRLTAQLEHQQHGDAIRHMSLSLPQLPSFAVPPTSVPNGDVISGGISHLPIDSQRNLIEHQIQNIEMGLVGEFGDQQGRRSGNVAFSTELTLASSDSSNLKHLTSGLEEHAFKHGDANLAFWTETA